MTFESFDLGFLERGVVVTLLLRAPVNVRLMTQTNHLAYQRRQFYRMLGGVALTASFNLTIPSNAHWFLVVDADGLAVPLRSPTVSVKR